MDTIALTNLSKKRKLDPSVIRVDDYIKIIIPEYVERVGYPLTTKIVLEKFTPEQKQKLYKCLLDTFGIPCKTESGELSLYFDYEKEYNGILNAVARQVMIAERWGGKERRIYNQPVEYVKDQVFRVYKKRVVKTGRYVPGYGGCDYWGEYDYESAYLEEEKTHVLYGVVPAVGFEPIIWTNDNIMYFEQRCVKKVHYNLDTGEYE
jgi:hypothetical protein